MLFFTPWGTAGPATLCVLQAAEPVTLLRGGTPVCLNRTAQGHVGCIYYADWFLDPMASPLVEHCDSVLVLAAVIGTCAHICVTQYIDTCNLYKHAHT